MTDRLDLWDYRRRVSEVYRQVREMGLGPDSHWFWRSQRDQLFATHPQAPIEPDDAFEGLAYFPYDPRYNVVATFVPEPEARWGDFSRIGRVVFDLDQMEHSLPIFWLDAYGGGIFLPFGDGTNVSATYGGGRYLLDTVKGADLGHDGDQMALDFNFAYHPSCVHSDRWTCPLAPPGSRLGLDIEAGEALRSSGAS